MTMRVVLTAAVALALLIGYVELRVPVSVGAQGGDAVYEQLAVTGAVRLEAFRGQIAAFNAACPANWDELTALRGRFIVGLVDGGDLALSVGTPLTNGELRRGGTAHSGPSFSRVSISDNLSVNYTRPTVSHGHTHVYSDSLRETAGIAEGTGQILAGSGDPVSNQESTSGVSSDPTVSGGGASLSGSVSISGGSVSGGQGFNRAPPAPYVQLRYCEYQP